MHNLPIDIGFYESLSSPLAAQRCVNLYPQNPQTKGAVSSGALFPTPGIKTFTTATGANRGFIHFQGDLYSVNGSQLLRVDNAGGRTFIGTIEGSGRVSLAQNGETLCVVVPGGKGYFYTKVDRFEEITDTVYEGYKLEVGGVRAVTTKDGYFCFVTRTTIFLSSLVVVNLGRDFDALQFGTADHKPDDNVSIAAVKNELYIFGTETIQVMQNVGGSGFPFQVVLGATIEKGLTGQDAYVLFDNSFLFLGSGVGEAASIWRGESGGASKVSTPAIDARINSYTEDELTNVLTFSYAQNGNFFACFTFPDVTFVYDAASSAMQQRNVWHERSTNGSQWRVNDMVRAFNKTLCGDSLGGLIGELTHDEFGEYDGAREFMFSGAYLSSLGNPLFVSAMELYCETGTGEYFTDHVDPQIKLEYSDDGARTFVDAGDRSLGKQEQYNKRLIWNRQGRVPYSRVTRFSTTTTAKVAFIQMNVEVAA